MEDLFAVLSSSARLDKRKNVINNNNKKRYRHEGEDDDYAHRNEHDQGSMNDNDNDNDDDDDDDSDLDNDDRDLDDGNGRGVTFASVASRDRTGKRDTSLAKQRRVHQEEMAAFRRSMAIRIAPNSLQDHPDLPDVMSSFDELGTSCRPSWWKTNHIQGKDKDKNHDDDDGDDDNSIIYRGLVQTIQRNVEEGRWKEPTPIQMQSIPTLLERKDLMGQAATGSGKSAAFIIPSLLLSGAPDHIYYNNRNNNNDNHNDKNKNSPQTKKKKPTKRDKTKNPTATSAFSSSSGAGQIRSLIVAPSRELAVQLYREVERLGTGKPGGLSALLLSKSNANHVIAGTVGGKTGMDVLVSTPLRLVDAIEKGLDLGSIRFVVLDECDRLLDVGDGSHVHHDAENSMESGHGVDHPNDDSEEEENEEEEQPSAAMGSGSTQTKSFLSQMDVILAAIPPTAVRALFSATITPSVKQLSESILRNPVDLRIATSGSLGGANADIEQELMFVGREEGKLLALRQLKGKGRLKPPALIFVQSQERAQALFGELLYDGIHVDVIHAGRSKKARDDAVAKFRQGHTWVLICTDVMARGVDFRAVNMVINYDMPTSAVTYVHRIGRTGRASRKGRAVTLFTEADFDGLRTVANVMKQSGCHVEDWMLQLSKKKTSITNPRPRGKIDTTLRKRKRKKDRKRKQTKDDN